MRIDHTLHGKTGTVGVGLKIVRKGWNGYVGLKWRAAGILFFA